MEDAERRTLRTIADYQFRAGAGRALFPDGETYAVDRSKSGRPRQVSTTGGERLVSLGTDGRFTLGLAGGRRLLAALDAPACRIVVGEESEPFVRDGKNVFAKFVREVDPEARAGDEVAVVTADRGGEAIAVGRVELDAGAIGDFDTGMAVKVREGAGESRA